MKVWEPLKSWDLELTFKFLCNLNYARVGNPTRLHFCKACELMRLDFGSAEDVPYPVALRG